MPLLRASLLKSEPAGTLRSLDELFALAYAMEQEAADRYTELAEEMRSTNAELSRVFESLAAAEREHVDGVIRWSQSRRGKAPDPALVRWQGPENLDEDAAAEIRTSRLMTPYRALSMAVRNEERAFAFWSYLAAYSEEPEVQKAAEEMAREELGHVAILRKERRRAYHVERSSRDASESGAAASRSQLHRAQVDAPTLELRLARQLADLERRLSGPAALRARELKNETLAMSTRAAGFGSFPASLDQSDSHTIAEALVEAYLEGAESSADESRLGTLQALAANAISRLAWLRSFDAR